MTAAEVVAILHAEPSGNGHHTGRCPAHLDSNPSLSISEGDDGKLLLHCHAGCTFAEVMAALRNGSTTNNGASAPGPRRIIATYPYKDERGETLYEAVRYEPKDFWQRRPDGRGGWHWNLDGVRRVLFNLPALHGQRSVFIGEGEKDVEALRYLGLVATSNAGGAGKWDERYTEQLLAAGIKRVTILPDNDTAGEEHAVKVARSCAAAGLKVKIVRLPGLPPKGDVSDWLAAGHTAADLYELMRFTDDVDAASLTNAFSSPWASAQAAPEFVVSAEPEAHFLDQYKMVTREAITEVFSPRGIGKTLVMHAIAVELAKQGKRVLLIDRDNPRSTLRRRLHGWGAGHDTPTLKVLSREHAPPLTNGAAWAKFPFAEYDLVILDSLDAAAEGVGEKDSSKPSQAIAPLLDIAHREGGPAVVVLGNTIKSGAHSRGSGVIEDRADIAYEVRDATDFMPSGRKPWFQELPAAGADAWGERAVRRKGRKVYRLAFIASKFRLGEEPAPFLLELDLSGEPWQLSNVTQTVVHDAEAVQAQQEAERAAKFDRAAAALLTELRAREARDETVLADRDAVPFLVQQGLSREQARALLQQQNLRSWYTTESRGRGKPQIIKTIPAIASVEGLKNSSAAEIACSATVQYETRNSEGISAGRINTGPRKSVDENPQQTCGSDDDPIISAASIFDPPEAATNGHVKREPIAIRTAIPRDDA